MHHGLRMFRQVSLGRGDPELRMLLRSFRDLDVAVDVGANVGVYSGVLSRLARTVVSLEPNIHCVSFLQRVLPPNCIVVRKAASDRCGEAVLRIPVYERGLRESRGTIAPGNRLAGSATRRVEEQRVVSEPLDQILAGPGLAGRRVGFIKVDVEGHEHAVLRGAEATIRAHHPALLVETEIQHGAPVAEVFGMLAQMGYRGHILQGGGLVEVDAAEFLRRQAASGAETVNNALFK